MFLLVASFSVNEKMYSLLVLTSTASVKLKQRLPVKGLIIKMLTENIILFPFRNLGAPVGHPARITSSEPYTSFWTNTGVQNSRWLTSMSCRKGNIAVSRPNLDGRWIECWFYARTKVYISLRRLVFQYASLRPNSFRYRSTPVPLMADGIQASQRWTKKWVVFQSTTSFDNAIRMYLYPDRHTNDTQLASGSSSINRLR